jgi:prepilin-type N-terminal cleavage/methylation domain-containing protein
MKTKRTNQKGRGFTIIEVMIVLTIAGLILLIVFLAVPALQRNSRNTQRKNDIAGLLSAVAEYVANNNGKMPNTCSGNTPAVFSDSAGGTTTSEAKVGYFQGGCSANAPAANGAVQMKATYSTSGPLGDPNGNTKDYVILTPGARCNGSSTTQGSTRQVAAVYETETGSGTYGGVCQEG